MKITVKNRTELAKAILQHGQMWIDEHRYVYFDEMLTKFIVVFSDESIMSNGFWNIKTWYTDPPIVIEDMQPVWVYDNDCEASMILAFYDGKNNRTFSSDGKREGYSWDNFKPLTLEEQKALAPMIEEMKKHLKP